MPGIETLALIITAAIGPTTVLASNLVYLGASALLYGGLSYGASVLQSLLNPSPSTPKPADGSYNLKQNVPPLSYVLGRVKKGGDYIFLEESSGQAYHIIVLAGHRINRFVTHYLHNKAATLDGSGNVTAPSNFVLDGVSYVNIASRLGLAVETAYSDVVATFTPNWTADHRGDGLASIRMIVKGPAQEDFLTIFPNQMPEHSALLEGALLYDPRKDSTQGGSGTHRYADPDTWEYSANIALMRLWHLCHPVGGKLDYSDMYLPDWQNAANVCDQNVTNRTGGTEKRYSGGLWFRANNDPTEVGRLLDEAAELVVYERADGKIGVHAGEYVEPDIILEQDSIFSISVDKNKRRAATVLAVRGRYVNPANQYNTEDAALYGDPYGAIDDNSERTRTFDNSVIQSHNHCQRKQKLTYIRANAIRVAITADYEAAKNVAFRRFIRVDYPSRGLTNAVIEITSAATVDLRNMMVSFSGIVVSDQLYAFNAATEEGAPGATVSAIDSSGPPVPTSFNVTILSDAITGGGSAGYAKATWAHVSNSLIYELQWQLASLASPAQSLSSKPGMDEVRSGYLIDGATYRFRLRSWGGGIASAWTAYINKTVVADPTPPASVTSVTKTGGVGQVTVGWTAPNSPNYIGARLYWNTVNNFSTATLVSPPEYGPPGATDSRVITGLTAGTRYAWVVAINGSGVAAAEVATGAFTVT